MENDSRQALRESLRRALADESSADVAHLHAELDREDLRPAELTALMDRMQHHESFGERVQAWWNDPQTQRIVTDLNMLGL